MCLRLCEAADKSMVDVLLHAVPLDLPPTARTPTVAAHASGYGCTGSWLFGIDKNTRSPSLARNLLQEITSLEAAEERARRGAGIPARHDFFDLHGEEDIPGMEYFTWRKLLRGCGARSRRRSVGKMGSGKEIARIHQLIQDKLLLCLQIAQLYAAEYQKIRRDGPENIRAAALGEKLRAVKPVAQDMLNKITEALRAQGGNHSSNP